MQNFQKYKYTALLCEAGTVLRLHCLHFYIARFSEPIDKLFETFDVKKADSIFYLNCFYEVFQKCDKYNIFVCSVTCDKLPAQTSGFQTFQITSDNPLIESVLKIPCFGHLCNNVFLDLVKKNSTFNELIHIILDTAHLLRTKEAGDFSNAKCLSISTTRWLYIVDILLKKKNDINSFIEIQNQANGTDYNKIDENYDFEYEFLILLKLFYFLKKNMISSFLILYNWLDNSFPKSKNYIVLQLMILLSNYI